MERLTCVLCGAGDFRFIYGPPGVGERGLERCNVCTLLQMKPMPTDAELTAYYQKYDVLGEREPYYAALWGADALNTDEGRDIVERTDWMLKHAKPSSVLDVGSGPGLFLRLMKEKGVKVEGVELNAPAAERSARELGVPVRSGTIYGIQDTKYTTITLWDLLEHVNDPRALVKKASELLERDGWLFIETPDERSLLDRAVRAFIKVGITGPADTFYGMHHLALFRPESVRRLLEEAGFKMVEIRGAQTSIARIFRGTSPGVRFMRLGLNILFFFARILGLQNKMLIAARKTT